MGSRSSRAVCLRAKRRWPGCSSAKSTRPTIGRGPVGLRDAPSRRWNPSPLNPSPLNPPPPPPPPPARGRRADAAPPPPPPGGGGGGGGVGAAPAREFPAAPGVGGGAVVPDGPRVLLARRGRP